MGLPFCKFHSGEGWQEFAPTAPQTMGREAEQAGDRKGNLDSLDYTRKKKHKIIMKCQFPRVSLSNSCKLVALCGSPWGQSGSVRGGPPGTKEISPVGLLP